MDPELKVVVVPVTPFQQNCSLLWCQQTGKGAAIDPGGDVEQIVAAAQENGIEIMPYMMEDGEDEVVAKRLSEVFRSAKSS